MLYLDTSALMKLIRREPESDTLADWPDAQTPAPWVSSTLIQLTAFVAYDEWLLTVAAAAGLPTAAPGR
jgi:predicted nucleic acid-binding protein